MKKNRFLHLFLALMIALPLASVSTQKAEATNFKGKEDYYYKLCQSSTLSKAKQKTCKEFNAYLKNKSSKLKKNVSDAKSDVNKTKDKLSGIADKIEKIEDEIASTQKRIKYVEKSIEKKKAQIKAKREELEDRIYIMQTNVNSNVMYSYLLDAKSFSDFLSRASTLNDITEYENDLINEIKEAQKELEQQESQLKDDKKTLEKDKKQATSLKNSYKQQLMDESKALLKAQYQLSKNQESIEKIVENLAAMKRAEQYNKGGDDGNVSYLKGGGGGNRVVNLALSKRGCAYVWGAAHSWAGIKNKKQNVFDCSGLVSWALYQAGYKKYGPQSTATLKNMGKNIKRSNMKPGDIILFSSNGSGGGVHHVGIYIGNGKMVHAPYTGTVVRVESINNPFYKREFYCARRLW